MSPGAGPAQGAPVGGVLAAPVGAGAGAAGSATTGAAVGVANTPSIFGLDLDPDTPRLLMPLAKALQFVNRAMVAIGMVALLAASAVLTSSVVSRYFLKASTDWQDEAAVFCLVGATFMCGAFVQSVRGHIGIEAVATLLPAGVNRIRLLAIDIVSFAFCSFFAWKSWTLLHEAWVDGQTTSSSWAPPLWIPYGLMTAGMLLLALQLGVQVIATLNRLAGTAPRAR